jgi:hypothetical protein
MNVASSKGFVAERPWTGISDAPSTPSDTWAILRKIFFEGFVPFR